MFNNETVQVRELPMMPSTLYIPMTLEPDAIIPKYAHDIDDTCCDLYALHETVILPHKTVLVKTGLRVAIPQGYVMLVCSRSGLALKTDLFVLNAPGVVDPGYRGDVGVILHNLSDQPVTVAKGDRIAQAMLIQTVHMHFDIVNDLDETVRGAGGFGSTGVK